MRRPPRAPPDNLLSTHALKASDTPMPLRMMRYLDLALLALALPIFIAADLPLLGWARRGGRMAHPARDPGADREAGPRV